MRVIKRIYSRDSRSLLLSKAFNLALEEVDIPVPFDYLEFRIGYSSLEIDERSASFGISADEPMFYMDMRIAKTLIKLELYRLFVRNIITRKTPPLIEYVAAAREMVKHRHADDLAFMFYVYMIRHRVKDYQAFLKFNMPWIIFSGHDGFYCDFFQELAKMRRRYIYEPRSKELFASLCKDLMDFENLKNATNAYEMAVYEK